MKSLKLFVATWLGLSLMPLPAAQAAGLVDAIAATVGSEIILLSDIRAREAVRKGRFGSKKKMSRQETLDELIEERLLSQEIDRLGIKVPQAELDQTVRMVLAKNHMTLDQLKRELAAKGVPWEAYRHDLEERLKMMKFMRQRIYSKIDVGEEDYDLYRRRYPQKSKQQSKKEIEQAILEQKSREHLKSYIARVRTRTYVEIKDRH